MVKVSVIVPIYNAEKYLKQCLDSIAAQTLEDIEIILIDDGSTDGSAEICKEYLSDPRVTYFHKENEGLAAARQDGMERASGEYLGFVDSDDWLEPDMYEKMYAAAKSCEAYVAFCNCVTNESDYYYKPEMRTGHFNRQQILDEILPKTLAYINDDGDRRAIRWSNCLRIYKKAIIDKHGIAFDRRFRRSQDSQLTYEAMLVAQNFYYLGDDYLYHNRVVGDSLSRGYTKNMWPLYVPLIERLYRDTEEFTERDYMPQMHLRNFFFVTECIDNEFKPTCPHGRDVKEQKILEIMSHPLTERYYGRIEYDKLNPLLQGYYRYIYKKDPAGLIDFVERYNKSKKKKDARKAKIMNFLTESIVMGTLYKKIRGKS